MMCAARVLGGSGEQRGNALENIAGEVHQLGQLPAAKRQQRNGQSHELGDETQGHLVDGGGRLNHPDDQTDHQSHRQQ